VARWVDLLDPDAATVRDALPAPVDEATLLRLAAPAGERVRPSVVDLETVVVATLVVPVVVRDEDALYLQEVEVVAAPDAVLTTWRRASSRCSTTSTRRMPELDWRLGYLYSWGVFVVVTVLQLAAFRRLRRI
jgi:hypothetical protein